MRDNKQDILIKLIEQGVNHPTIRKISQITGIKYSNTYNIVKKLENEKLIYLEKIGNAYKCKLNKIPHPLIFSAEYKRRDELIENSDFRVIHQKLNNFAFPLIALLFGSHAKRTARTTSDIDIMIIAENKREKEVQRIISILPLDIHLVFFNYEEFTSMMRSKEFSVVSEATNNNVILVGIEDYYRVMEIAG